MEDELWEHMNRVADRAISFGTYLNLNHDDSQSLWLIAKYHDIGKVLISKNILHKKDKLTEEEIIIIKQHPELSYKILSSVKGIEEQVLRGVYQHHERIDGTGYPNGLTSDNISKLAKMVSLCDAYDVMTHGRSYSAALSKEEALVEIQNCLGTQFDVDIGQQFIDFINLLQ